MYNRVCGRGEGVVLAVIVIAAAIKFTIGVEEEKAQKKNSCG